MNVAPPSARRTLSTRASPDLTALAGALGPLVFLAGTVVASRLQQDFMEELGWDVWPSGLALGPHGWLQIANFLLVGLLLLLFALGVHRGAANRKTKVAAGLFGVAGVGALLLAFKTDPEELETWHGLVHYVGYLLFVATVLLGYVFFWLGVWRNPEWRRTRIYGLYALVLFLPALALPDAEALGNYVFLALLLAPLAAFALRLDAARSRYFP